MDEIAEIPFDVMEAARAAHAQFADSRVTMGLGEIIARAILAERLAERERCAKVAELYSEVSWEKCTDSILLDPVLSNHGRRKLTKADWERAESMAIDGTIASAAYHAANHIASAIRNPLTNTEETK